ncbi:MAG: hypothetical protein ACI9EF_003359 [Pseudohongiellaceae bacterium]|jgi:hypothetical protein
MRIVGYLLAILLTLLCLALHQRSTWRAGHLIAGEHLAQERLAKIHSLAKGQLRIGEQAQLATLLSASELADVAFLESLSKPGVEFAADSVYVYGLAQTTAPFESGKGPRHGFILRAWPVEFGVTGDLQFHADSRGNSFQGQNNKGRSGVTVDFPPPFPATDLGSRGAGWWREPLAPAAHK